MKEYDLSDHDTIPEEEHTTDECYCIKHCKAKMDWGSEERKACYGESIRRVSTLR